MGYCVEHNVIVYHKFRYIYIIAISCEIINKVTEILVEHNK